MSSQINDYVHDEERKKTRPYLEHFPLRKEKPWQVYDGATKTQFHYDNKEDAEKHWKSLLSKYWRTKVHCECCHVWITSPYQHKLSKRHEQNRELYERQKEEEKEDEEDDEEDDDDEVYDDTDCMNYDVF